MQPGPSCALLAGWRFFSSPLGLGVDAATSDTVCAAQVYEQNGLFDTTFRIAADYDFILRLLSRKGVGVRYIPEVMVKMRVGGSEQSFFAKYHAEIERGFAGIKAQ